MNKDRIDKVDRIISILLIAGIICFILTCIFKL